MKLAVLAMGYCDAFASKFFVNAIVASLHPDARPFSLGNHFNLPSHRYPPQCYKWKLTEAGTGASAFTCP
jgi:hypothetical protein